MFDAATGGATGGSIAFAAALIGGPALADMAGNGKPDLVFEFADALQPMVAVNPTDGAIVWRGPAGLNPRLQPRSEYNVLQTSSGDLLVVTANRSRRSIVIRERSPGAWPGCRAACWSAIGPATAAKKFWRP